MPARVLSNDPQGEWYRRRLGFDVELDDAQPRRAHALFDAGSSLVAQRWLQQIKLPSARMIIQALKADGYFPVVNGKGKLIQR